MRLWTRFINIQKKPFIGKGLNIYGQGKTSAKNESQKDANLKHLMKSAFSSPSLELTHCVDEPSLVI